MWKIMLVFSFYIFNNEMIVEGASCCKGVVYQSSLCYWITDNDGTEAEIQTECEKGRGNLASIPAAQIQQFLIDNYASELTKTDEVFIGVNDKTVEGVYTDWNGASLSWENWKPGGPTGGIDRQCVVMMPKLNTDAYSWLDNPCNGVSFPGLCLREVQDTTSCKGVQLSDTCYWITESSEIVDNLNTACQVDGGVLATIPSPAISEELEILYDCVLSQNNEIYLGVQQTTSYEWTTWDGHPVTWAPWLSGITLNDASKSCVRIFPFSAVKYSWENKPCDENYRGLCFKNETSYIQSTGISTQSQQLITDEMTTDTYLSVTGVTTENSDELNLSEKSESSSVSDVTMPPTTNSLGMTNEISILLSTIPCPTMSAVFATLAPTSNNSTMCLCGKVYFISDAYVARITEEVVFNLTVDKQFLSSTRRRKISVPDSRPSARLLGSLGMILVLVEVGVVVLLDANWYYSIYKKIIKYYKRRKIEAKLTPSC